MTLLEQNELSPAALPSYKVMEYKGLKVKFKMIPNPSKIVKSHVGIGSEEVLPSIPASEFL